MTKILLDGDIVNQSDAPLFITDKAVWYDFGVYESIKVLQGKLFYPELHIKRLVTSAGIIDLKLGVTEGAVLDWVRSYREKLNLHDHVIKICAYGDTEANRKARIYMFSLGLTFYPDKFYRRGVKAATIDGERFMPRAKTLNLLQGFVSLREAKKRGAVEGIMIDTNGFAREGIRSSLFVVEGDKLITSPDEFVLDGVTRHLVLRLATESDIEVTNEKISKKRLYEADEVFVTATVMNVMPVNQVDDRVISDGKVGEVTRRLVRSFSKMQKEYVQI